MSKYINLYKIVVRSRFDSSVCNGRIFRHRSSSRWLFAFLDHTRSNGAYSATRVIQSHFSTVTASAENNLPNPVSKSYPQSSFMRELTWFYYHLQSLPDYKTTFFDVEEAFRTENVKNFNEKVSNFIEISKSPNLLPVIDSSFDSRISNLLDDIKLYTIEELVAILFHLKMFPKVTPRDEKYKNIWSKIDEELLCRIPQMGLDTSLQINDVIYDVGLNLEFLFHWKTVKKFIRKADSLSKVHFVRLMYCLSFNPKLPKGIKTYDLEFNLKRLIKSMSVHEIGLIVYSLNKLSAVITNDDLWKEIFEIFAKESKIVTSQAVTSVSKAVMRTRHHNFVPSIYAFQEAMMPEFDRLGINTAIHVGFIGTKIGIKHEKMIQCLLEKVKKDVGKLGLPYLKKVCNIIMKLCIHCDELCDAVVNELKYVLVEDLKHVHNAKQLPAAVNFLCMHGKIHADLIAQVLSSEFLQLCYDKTMYIYKHEILQLDATAEIEVNDYQGARLTEKELGYLSKRHMYWLDWLSKPESERTNESQYKRAFRSVVQTANELFGGPDFVLPTNVLPHHSSAEVVFCTNTNREFVQIPPIYQTDNREYGIKRIPSLNENVQFHVLMIIGRSNCLYDSKTITGNITSQKRQMEKLGYITHQIFETDWIKIIEDENSKRQYLSKILMEIND